VGDADRLPEEFSSLGVVVCVHVFGLGVYLPDQGAFGHVNVTAMGVEATRSLDDYPAVASRLEVQVLGYTGDQLRLAVRQ
jgi:hypothetical protein